MTTDDGDAGKSSAELESELRFYLARADISVPEDRMLGMLSVYREIREMLVLLRGTRTAADEPSNIYSLDTISRSS